MDPKTLFIMPQVEDKFIKFVDVGETEIYEITDKGDRMDDTMKYEVQRSMGVGTQIGRYSRVSYRCTTIRIKGGTFHGNYCSEKDKDY